MHPDRSFGDITATTTAERVVATVMMFIGEACDALTNSMLLHAALRRTCHGANLNYE